MTLSFPVAKWKRERLLKFIVYEIKSTPVLPRIPFPDCEVSEKFPLWALVDTGHKQVLVTKNAVIAPWQDFSL